MSGFDLQPTVDALKFTKKTLIATLHDQTYVPRYGKLWSTVYVLWLEISTHYLCLCQHGFREHMTTPYHDQMRTAYHLIE